MTWRSFLVLSAIAFNAVYALPLGTTSAARLPTSTITVDVVSVDRESFNREETKYPGRPTVAFETSKFVAKAHVTKVVATEHGLQEGADIEIRYSVTVRDPPDPFFHVAPTLSPGEAKTLTVFGGGSRFIWRQ